MAEGYLSMQVVYSQMVISESGAWSGGLANLRRNRCKILQKKLLLPDFLLDILLWVMLIWSDWKVWRKEREECLNFSHRVGFAALPVCGTIAGEARPFLAVHNFPWMEVCLGCR